MFALGLGLTLLIALTGLWLSEWIGTTLLGFEKSPVSGIMTAILVGMLVGNLLPLDRAVKRGVNFSAKTVLKWGIILLGIRIGLGDVVRLGAFGVPIILLCVVGALWLSRWLGARLQVSARMSALIAVGTSICGATAIVATGPAIKAKEEEITYAVANITVFGVLAMFAYPFLAQALFPDAPTSAGVFLGTSIHETAQVAGSGLIYDQLYDAPVALEAATITKLARNLLMVLIIPLMAYSYQQGEKQKDASNAQPVRFWSLFPVFILGFIGMALVRTVGDATVTSGAAFGLLSPEQWTLAIEWIRSAAEWLLAIAMAAVGLGTRFRDLRGLGLRPFYVGFAAALTVGSLSLLGIALLS